jgi:hypothetical protein
MSDAKVRTFARFPAGTNPLAALHEAMAANIEGSPGFGSLAKALDHERSTMTRWDRITVCRRRRRQPSSRVVA